MGQVKNSKKRFFTFFDRENRVFDIFSKFFDRKRDLSEYDITKTGFENTDEI